jgi:rRNA maturation RNase YbeY
MAINFFTEDIKSSGLKRLNLVKSWIKKCVTDNDRKIGNLNYIFCSDEFLKGLNKEYLNHDYYTDIITFNNNEGNIVSGDIYISTERVDENAIKFGVEYLEELHRVIIHGLLHLLGFKDKKPSESKEMREQENFWLQSLKDMD